MVKSSYHINFIFSHIEDAFIIFGKNACSILAFSLCEVRSLCGSKRGYAFFGV